MKTILLSIGLLLSVVWETEAQNIFKVLFDKLIRECHVDGYVLKQSQTVVYPGVQEGLVNIICTDKSTKVVLTVKVGYDNAWVFFSENTFLRDCQTGDLYKVRQMQNELPLGKTIYIYDMEGAVLQFTMIFPPLKLGVKTIDYLQYDSNRGKRPLEGNNWTFTNLNLSEFPVKEPKIIL